MNEVKTALHRLNSSAGTLDPYPIYEEIRGLGSVARRDDSTLVISGFHECSRALRNTALAVPDAPMYDATRPGWRERPSLMAFLNSMLFSNDENHDRMRAVVRFAFTPPKIEELRSTIQQMADDLLEEISRALVAGEEVDLIEQFAARLPMAVVTSMMGFDRDDEQWFRQIATELAVATDGAARPADLTVADDAMRDLRDYFETTLGPPGQDAPGGPNSLLSVMKRAHDSPSPTLNDLELGGNLMLLLTAGFETTSFLIGLAALHAMEGGYQQRLGQDSEFATTFVEEALRFYPPVHITTRVALQDLEIEGHKLRAGSRVILLLAAANRDPEQFSRPLEFEPTRDPRPLSFGAGKHFCLGAPLARVEAHVALQTLFRRFPTLEPGRPTARNRVVVRGLDTLPALLPSC